MAGTCLNRCDQSFANCRQRCFPNPSCDINSCFDDLYLCRERCQNGDDPHAGMTARSNFYRTYAQRRQRPMVSTSLTARQSFAQRSNGNNTDWKGQCFSESDTIIGARDCVENACGWNCEIYPDRKNLCREQCKDVIGWTYEPGCDADGPDGCVYDRHAVCQRVCEIACDWKYFFCGNCGDILEGIVELYFLFVV